MRLFYLILFALAFIAPTHANQDSGLYTLASKDKAFLRIVNDTTDKHITVNRSDMPDALISPYYRIDGKSARVRSNKNTRSLTLKPGLFYTLWLRPDGKIKLFVDSDALRDISKMQVTLYNLTSEPLRLATVDNRTIIAKVESGKAGLRMINPVSIDFALYHGQHDMVAKVPSFSRQNNQRYSIIAFPSGQVHVETATLNELP